MKGVYGSGVTWQACLLSCLLPEGGMEMKREPFPLS